MLKIGHGFDVHGFEEGNKIILGGVSIAHNKAFKAHSDGDVLIHALIDALMGALALGDIGEAFPDTDQAYKDISSLHLLEIIKTRLDDKKASINNIDITIIAQQPKLKPYKETMRTQLAKTLALQLSQINIKATTTEGLGYTGREEGIAVHCVTLLEDNT